MFAYLPTDQKMKRMLHMWARVYTKLNAANLLIHKYKDLRIKTRVQGRYNAVKYRRDFNEEEEETEPFWIILPDNKLKKRWNLWIGVLLVYTGIFVPLRVAFYDETTLFMLAFECLVDFFFITDICLTFISAYEKNNVIETRHRQLASTYLRGWFLIDVLSSIPFQLLEVAIEN